MLADDYKIFISVLEDRGASNSILHDYKLTGVLADDSGTPEIWIRGSKASGESITLQTHGSNPENADYALCVMATMGGDNFITYSTSYMLPSMGSNDTLTVDIFSEGFMPGGTTERIKRKRIFINRY